MSSFTNHPSQPNGGTHDDSTQGNRTIDSSTAQSKNNRPKPISTFPEPILRVRPWRDEILSQQGHDPRSLYVEQYWLPILGPTATLLLRRVALAFDERPDGFEIDCAQWAQELGIGMRGGKNGPFWRAIDRTCRFGTAQRNGDLFMVHPQLARLSMHQVVRLPDHLRISHQTSLARQHSSIPSSVIDAA